MINMNSKSQLAVYFVLIGKLKKINFPITQKVTEVILSVCCMEPHTLSFVHFCSAFNHLEFFWSCLHICLKM